MTVSAPRLTRRELVAGATATGLLAAVPPAWARSLLAQRPRVGPGAFLDGVASGEPGARAVTFWSRLETERLRSGARLVVARDRGLRRVVATTVVPTGRGVNGTLKARIGGLKPGTDYFYAWESGTDVSPIGRTRTAPAADSVEALSIAYSSCQQYALGHFAAHAHAATVPDLDLYLFLGDYVYESQKAELRADGIDAVDLASYRSKYALYRSDPGLRELHRVHPVAHIWDDHEVENNYSDGQPAPSRAQRSAAYRAAFEWMPRMAFPSDRHRIYKRLSFGRVADVFLLDERQYRVQTDDGQRAMLGDAQMRWLLGGLRASRARWKLIAQQVVVAQDPYGTGRSAPDRWDGYPQDRARLLGELERAGITDVAFLTGDAHVFMASLLASDFEALGDGTARRPAAVEFVGGPVTSRGRQLEDDRLRARAPWVRQYDGYRHGYAHLALRPDQLRVEYRASDLRAPDGATVAFERFDQPAGQNDFARQRLTV